MRTACEVTEHLTVTDAAKETAYGRFAGLTAEGRQGHADRSDCARGGLVNPPHTDGWSGVVHESLWSGFTNPDRANGGFYFLQQPKRKNS